MIERATALARLWRLTEAEIRGLLCLHGTNGGNVSVELLHKAFSRRAETNKALVRVRVCMLNKKINGHGVKIESVRGVGYHLTKNSFEAIDRAFVASCVHPFIPENQGV